MDCSKKGLTSNERLDLAYHMPSSECPHTGTEAPAYTELTH